MMSTLKQAQEIAKSATRYAKYLEKVETLAKKYGFTDAADAGAFGARLTGGGTRVPTKRIVAAAPRKNSGKSGKLEKAEAEKLALKLNEEGKTGKQIAEATGYSLGWWNILKKNKGLITSRK